MAKTKGPAPVYQLKITFRHNSFGRARLRLRTPARRLATAALSSPTAGPLRPAARHAVVSAAHAAPTALDGRAVPPAPADGAFTASRPPGLRALVATASAPVTAIVSGRPAADLLACGAHAGANTAAGILPRAMAGTLSALACRTASPGRLAPTRHAPVEVAAVMVVMMSPVMAAAAVIVSVAVPVPGPG